MSFFIFFNNLINWITAHGMRIVLILILTWISWRLLKIFIKKSFRKTLLKIQKIKKEALIQEKRILVLENTILSAIKLVIWVLALIMILPEFGINITPILTGLGIGGLALGFGARTLVQDYISGLFILLEDHFRIGEEVEILGIRGKVKSFNLRRTVLEDKDKNLYFIPNSQIKKVLNFSRK